MAQTTGAVSAVNAVVEYSTDGSSWTDASGHGNKVTVSGGDRKTGAIETFTGDTMILTGGKRNTYKLAVDIVYTESTGELQRAAETAQRAGSPFYLRYTVKAASTGNRRFTSSAGILTKASVPSIDASDPKPVMVSLELETPELTPASIP